MASRRGPPRRMCRVPGARGSQLSSELHTNLSQGGIHLCYQQQMGWMASRRGPPRRMVDREVQKLWIHLLRVIDRASPCKSQGGQTVPVSAWRSPWSRQQIQSSACIYVDEGIY